MAGKDTVTRILITAKDEASGVFSGLRRHAGKIATAIAGYFSAKFFSGSIKSAAEFEAQMSTVAAVTRATADDMDLLRKAADEAGTNTRFTATEAAVALENLARAGLNARESVEALPAVLGLAQANGVGLAEASSLVTRAVRGMGLEVAESGRVADVLTEAAARANTKVEGLGQALAYAAPTAQSLGLSLEDTVAIIGKFADAGIDASRAGTALNSILAQFSNPASKFRQELRDAGITTDDFNLALRQLGDAGPQGAKAILAVGQEAGPALRALLNQGIGSLDDLRAALGNAEGAAARAAAVMDNNLDGAMRGLSSAWDGFRRSLAAPVLEPITAALAGLSERMRTFVSSGVMGQIGEVIASAFQQASQAFFDFLDRLDIDAVIAQLRAWGTTTRETVEEWSQHLSNASTVATAAFGAIATGFNVVKTGSLTLAASIAQSMSALTGMYARLLEMISGVIPQMRQSAEEWRSVSDAFGEAARQNFDRATEAADRTQESFFRTTEALGDLLGLEQQAAAQTANTAAAIERTGQAAALTADQLDAMGEGYEYVDGSARQAAEGIDATTSAAADAARTLNGAAEAVVDVDEAFRELGVTSVAELQRVADRARVAFDAIKASGTASVDDVQRAFRVYAERAIAANGGVVDSTLQSTARMLGLKVEADETGRVIVRAMNKAAAATGGLVEQTRRAAIGVRDLARAARDAEAAAQGGGSGNGRAAGMPALNQLTGNYDRAERIGGKELRQTVEEIYKREADFRRLPMSWTTYLKTMSKVFQEQEKAIEAFEERQQRIDARAAAGRDTRPTSAPAQQSFTPAAGPQLGTVTINLGGHRRRRIETTAAGARELEALLRELESSMERAT